MPEWRGYQLATLLDERFAQRRGLTRT